MEPLEERLSEVEGELVRLQDELARLQGKLKRIDISLARPSFLATVSQWRYGALALATFSLFIVGSPMNINTPLGSYESKGVDLVGLLGAAASAYAIYQGKKLESQIGSDDEED